MTQKEIKQNIKKLDKLYNNLYDLIQDNNVLEMIYKVVDLELLLEAEFNK